MLITKVASADDTADSADEARSPLTLRSERSIERRVDGRAPLLRLDYDLPVASYRLDATTERHGNTLELGHRVRVAAESSWWKAKMFTSADEARGWRSAAELSIGLGPFRVGVTAGYGHVDSRLQRGTYRIVGISATRTVRLSRWAIGWVSLGLGE